jgi:hypothetical protein
MPARHQISDKDLTKNVVQKLSGLGASSQARIAATVHQGAVTLSGLLQYPGQRRPIVEAVASVAGVGRVVDLMQIIERLRTMPDPFPPSPLPDDVDAPQGVAWRDETAPSITPAGDADDS